MTRRGWSLWRRVLFGMSQQVALAWTWTAFSVVAVGGVTAVIGSDL